LSSEVFYAADSVAALPRAITRMCRARYFWMFIIYTDARDSTNRVNDHKETMAAAAYFVVATCTKPVSTWSWW
jgi:hypothetical protein